MAFCEIPQQKLCNLFYLGQIPKKMIAQSFKPGVLGSQQSSAIFLLHSDNSKGSENIDIRPNTSPNQFKFLPTFLGFLQFCVNSSVDDCILIDGLFTV